MLIESIEKHFLAIFLGSNLILTGLGMDIYYLDEPESLSCGRGGNVCFGDR